MFSKTYSSNSLLWEEKKTILFDELILSWNGLRPSEGKWAFWVCLKEDEWHKVAEWGANGQRSFQSEKSSSICHQDIVKLKTGLVNSFRVKVVGPELEKLQRIFACVSRTNHFKITFPRNLPSIRIKTSLPFSQMTLDHPRCKDLCSPTSVANALSCLGVKVNPIDLAYGSHDNGFDIYGNWALNVAEGYHQSAIPCHVERLENFRALLKKLSRGKPVVVSVKGALSRAPKPYSFGHLCCVVGYENGTVFVLDPAFESEILIGYDLKEFLKAWGERRNLAYIFDCD